MRNLGKEIEPLEAGEDLQLDSVNQQFGRPKSALIMPILSNFVSVSPEFLRGREQVRAAGFREAGSSHLF